MSGKFEGWYFKQQSDNAAIALIPAIHTGRDGRKSGSLQIVTRDKAWCVELPEAPAYKLKPALSIRACDFALTAAGIILNLRRPDITVTGQLLFGPLTPPNGDIMGPYQYIPFMECRHSVFSLTHTVNGSLTLDGRRMDFFHGTGYIEGDRGRSFPKRYIWTQLNWLDRGPCALMLSAADVRPMGIPFIGIIGFVYFHGTEHRIATYRGAKIDTLGGGHVSVRQGEMHLTAQLLDWSAGSVFEAQKLRAPVSGSMTRLIRESLSCRVRYTFTVKECVLFDFITDEAGFEYEF